MFESARYSSFPDTGTDPGHVKIAEKGKNCVCVLADGAGELKGNEQVGSKVTRVVIENYLRRPSLKDEAMEKILEFASSGVLVRQTPGSRVECNAAMLFVSGGSFRWVRAGAVYLMHFVDGQLLHAAGRSESAPLGAMGAEKAEMLSSTDLGQGENSFLLCSASLVKYVTTEEIESALSMADTPADWLNTLRSLFESRSAGETLSLMTIFAPSRRKRRMKKPVVIGLIVVILAAAIFFGMGALRRRGPGGPGGSPGNPPQPPAGTTQDGTTPVGPNGETPPAGPNGETPPAGSNGQTAS